MTKLDANLTPVLNMLNTRYFIFPLQGGETVPVFNPYALGNAGLWMKWNMWTMPTEK